MSSWLIIEIHCCCGNNSRVNQIYVCLFQKQNGKNDNI